MVEEARTQKGLLASPEVRLACFFALAVTALRLWIARSVHFCGTPDACYYLGMAQTLASGKGFRARFLYDFQLPHLSLPNSGIEYWRPGTSLFLQVLRPFGTVTLHGSVVVTVCTALLFAAAAWRTARHHNANRRLAAASFALCLVTPPAWTGSLSPDSGLYYGTAVAWFLALFTVRRQGLLQDLLALLCVAAAYLIRNDAALLFVPFAVILWKRFRHTLPPHRQSRQSGGSSTTYSLAMLCGFGLALLPMHLIYRSVLGTAFPSGTAQAAFLYDLSDFVRYNDPVSLHSLLSHGLSHLLLLRLATLVTALYRIAALIVGYAGVLFLLPLLPWRRLQPEASIDRSSDWVGPIAFFATLLAVYVLLLPAIGGFSILRSVLGILPTIVFCLLLGLHRAVPDRRLAGRLTLGLIGIYSLAGLLDSRRQVEAANRLGDADRHAAATLRDLGAQPNNAVVMTADPVQFSVTTGYTTLALPINGLDAVALASHRFHATHVILNTDDPIVSPEALQNRLHPVTFRALGADHLLVFTLPAAPAGLPESGNRIDH